MDIHHFISWPSAITVSPLFLYLFPPWAGCFSSVLPVFLLCVWFHFISTHVEHLGACYLVSVCRGFLHRIKSVQLPVDGMVYGWAYRCLLIVFWLLENVSKIPSGLFFVCRGQEECLSCVCCLLHTTFCWGNKPTNFVFKEKINKSQTRLLFSSGDTRHCRHRYIHDRFFFKFYLFHYKSVIEKSLKL